MELVNTHMYYGLITLRVISPKFVKKAYYYEEEPPVINEISNNTKGLENKNEFKIESKEKGFFSVQIASYPNLKMAQDIERDLKSKTYPAFIQEVVLPGKGTWYRVRIGNFATKEEADLYAKNIRNIDPSINSTLVTLNN